MSTVQGADRFERSTRFWLRAYPVRWRSVRGDELLDVLRDLAGPDATRLPLREALGLVRAGWATRWREGPPLRTRLTYRLLEIRIPPRYREWARDDIDGRWYDTRRGLLPAVLFVTILGLGSAGKIALSTLAPALVVWAVVLLALLRLDLLRPLSDPYRARAVNRHLVPRHGEPVTPGGFMLTPGTGTRVDARLGTTLACATLAAGALMWTAATLVAPRGLTVVGCPLEPGAFLCTTVDTGPWQPWWWVALAAVALVVGLFTARRAERRFADLLADRPAQPYRVLVHRVPGAVTALVLLVPLAAWQAWFEVTGRWVALISPVAATLCLLMLPGALVARRAARRGPDDLALIDLWRAGAEGQPPQVDEWVPAVVRVPVVVDPASGGTGARDGSRPSPGGPWSAPPGDLPGPQCVTHHGRPATATRRPRPPGR
ncbi:MAG: hypothetical protein L6367_06550 [Cellulomonas sp.]|nr:hypothetical protein [Cellulomonas sp.]